MAFDFKKEYKEFYMAKSNPEIVMVPAMNYIAVRGKGNPNTEEGAYQQAIGILYAIAYTLKMSYKGNYKIEGFFDYVVPPLEGFWWQDGICGVDYDNKDTFNWISVIRLPEFVTKRYFDWVVEEITQKKKMDCSSAEYLTIEEGLCVQIMHIGAFDDEPATVAIMDKYLKDNGYENDFTDERLHHEIYLSDIRKVEPEKWKTVIRHPIKKKEDVKDSYFKSVAHKYIFALSYTDTRLRQELLNITEELYTDEKKAKEWRNRIVTLIHPDKCKIEGAAEACAKLSDLYKRMVDKDE